MNGRLRTVAATLVVLSLLAAGCGSGGSPLDEPPVGSPLLPDLAPLPPIDMQMRHKKDKWYIAFSSTLVNVGKGDFVLVAKRGIRDWRVEQGLFYSESGGRYVRVRAPVVWGGDGHDHWHIRRVATMRLVAIDAAGNPLPEGGRVDAKIGFCFFDHRRLLEESREKARYSRKSCGKEDSSTIGMGLSPGWRDTYAFNLPGQSIDVTDLPDGRYRVWADVDESGWFREANTSNNRTWVDIELSTKDDLRFALIVKVGPRP